MERPKRGLSAFDDIERLDQLGEVGKRPRQPVDLVDAPVAVGVPAGFRPFADIPALKRGAGRQDDVRELGLAFHPDRLVDHELDATANCRR